MMSQLCASCPTRMLPQCDEARVRVEAVSLRGIHEAWELASQEGPARRGEPSTLPGWERGMRHRRVIRHTVHPWRSGLHVGRSGWLGQWIDVVVCPVPVWDG